MPFAVLASLARIAHKYEVGWLLAEATCRLKTAFPDQFVIWQDDMSTSSVTMAPQDTIEAFNLFRRIGRLDMLPTAMYACCQLDLGRLIHGVVRADGAFTEKLSIDDIERCLKARRELTTSNVELALSLFSPVRQVQRARQKGRAMASKRTVTRAIWWNTTPMRMRILSLARTFRTISRFSSATILPSARDAPRC